MRQCRWLLKNVGPRGVRHQLRGQLAVGRREASSCSTRWSRAASARGADAGHRLLRAHRLGRLTAHAVKLGCGGVLMLPPFYYKGVSDEGLFRSFAEVIERVGDARLRCTSITSRRCRRCRSRSA